jgi:hypothetical protein
MFARSDDGQTAVEDEKLTGTRGQDCCISETTAATAHRALSFYFWN